MKNIKFAYLEANIKHSRSCEARFLYRQPIFCKCKQLAPFSGSTYKISKGLIKLGYTPFYFLPNELEKLKITKDTPVRGTVRTVKRALKMLGVKEPPNIDIPDELKKYANRRIWKSTLGNVYKLTDAGKTVFVKPLKWQKAFNGTVLYPGDGIAEFPDDFPVLAQEHVVVENEYRCFILNNKILDIVDYGTYNTGGPPKSFIKKIIKDFKNPPAAYVIDVAQTRKICRCKTCKKFKNHDYFVRSAENSCEIPFAIKDKELKWSLIEINDGFSCGMFEPLSDKNAAKMTIARWKELVNA